MSTGPASILYHEALDDAFVYLELEGAHFEAEPGRVLVAIPAAVWEFIRVYPGADLSLVEKTDETWRGSLRARWTSGSPCTALGRR